MKYEMTDMRFHLNMIEISVPAFTKKIQKEMNSGMMMT